MKKFTKQVIMMCLMTTITHIGLSQCNSWLRISSPNPLVWGARSVTTDQENNVYSTGYFHGSVSFGSINLTNPTGGTSFYVNKINSGGVTQWAIQLPVTTYLFPPVICQKNGVLFIAGAFADTVIIGSNTITTSFGTIIGYIPEFGGAGNSRAYTLGITVNSINEIYLTGRVNGNFTFGSTILNSLTGSYTYLTKFNFDLNTIWAIQSTSTAAGPDSRGWGITLDNNENVIIGGYFIQEIEFGTVSFNADNSWGGRNPYIAKFDTAGNCQWIRGGKGPQTFSPVYTVVSDISGNIYYTGAMDSTMVIDGNTLNTTNGVFYYCKYTPTGNLVWVHQAGNNTVTEAEAPTSLVIDGSNNMWNSGWIDGPTSFGGYSLSHWGVFIAKLDLDGNFQGVIGGIGLESSYQSVLDADGNLFIAGLAAGDTISFDGNTIININDTSGVDFVLKYCTQELGIESISISDNQVSIFPNPTKGNFTITFPTTTRQIQILNSLGQVLQIKFVDNEKSIDFELTDNGIYLVRIMTNRQTINKKLIVCKR
ncbi:MAG: T9SS type A sorting domain-containing protein [Bacteroidales bacterium]